MNKEEIIKDIQNIINANSGTISEQSAKSIAKALYNAGYRKVPDGAVILTPKERDEELKACNEKQAELEAKIEILKIQNKNLEIAFDRLEARSERFESNMKSVLEIEKKNTAKEFAEKLKAIISEKGTLVRDYTGDELVLRREVDVDEALESIDKLFEEVFGNDEE